MALEDLSFRSISLSPMDPTAEMLLLLPLFKPRTSCFVLPRRPSYATTHSTSATNRGGAGPSIQLCGRRTEVWRAQGGCKAGVKVCAA